MENHSHFIPNEKEMLNFGTQLMSTLSSTPNSNGITLFLNGDLGAGKTTLSRGMIQSLGHQGNVKSPTYTLVEEYHLQDKHIYHFDLYRLSDPEELEFMGIRDYLSAKTICLIEWAERGKNFLPPADLFINIQYANKGRQVELIPQSHLGKKILTTFNS